MGDNQTAYLHLNFGSDAERNANWTKLDARILALARGIFANIPAGGDLTGYYPDPLLADHIYARLPPVPVLPGDLGKVLEVGAGGTLIWATVTSGGGLPPIVLPDNETDVLRVVSGVPAWSPDTWFQNATEQLVLPMPTQVSGVPTNSTTWGISWGTTVKSRMFNNAATSGDWRFNWKSDDSHDSASDGWGIRLSTGAMSVLRRTSAGVPSTPLLISAASGQPTAVAIFQGGVQVGDWPDTVVFSGGAMRYRAGHLQGYNGSWVNLDDPTPGSYWTDTGAYLVPSPNTRGVALSASNHDDLIWGNAFIAKARLSFNPSEGGGCYWFFNRSISGALDNGSFASWMFAIEADTFYVARAPAGVSGVTHLLTLGPAGDLVTTAGLQFGAAAIPQDGMIQWTGTHFQGRIAGVWTQLDNAAAVTGLPPGGGAGTVLTKNTATDYDASWIAPALGGSNGSLGTQNIYTTNTTLSTANHDSLINANAASVQLTLPAFSTTLSGQLYRITRVDAQSANQATIMPAGADFIDGANAFITLAPYESVTLMACGTVANNRQWERVADPTWRTIQTGNVLTPRDGNKVLVSQAAGNAMQWGARTVKARLGAGLVADATSSAYLSLNCPAPFNAGTDNTGEPSWLLRLQGTSDRFDLLRAPATSGTTPVFASLLNLDNAGNLAVNAAGSAQCTLSVYGAASSGAFFRGFQSRGTVGAPTATQNNDILAQLSGSGYGTAYGENAILRFNAIETWTGTAHGTNSVIYTTPAGSTALSNTLIFDQNGNLTINGSVGQKSTGTTWANPSDIRLKKNILPYTRGLEAIVALQPKTFEFNGLGGSQDGLPGIGLIADEVQPVMPEMVSSTQTKLLPDDEQPVDLLMLDTTALQLALVNAVKELADRVAALEARPA